MDNDLIRVVEIYPAIEGEGIMTGTPQVIVRFQGCNLSCAFCDEERTWKEGILNPEDIQLFSNGEALLTRIEQVVREAGHPIEWISLTGGEPLARPVEQLIQVVTALKQARYKVAVQTNGSIPRPHLFPLVDFWSVTPTLSSSGHSILLRPAYMRAVEQILAQMKNVIINRDRVRGQLKFVIGSDEDIDEASELVDRWSGGLLDNANVPIIVQPVWEREPKLDGGGLPVPNPATAENPKGDWMPIEHMQRSADILSRHPLILNWPRVRIMLQQHKVIHGTNAKQPV